MIPVLVSIFTARLGASVAAAGTIEDNHFLHVLLCLVITIIERYDFLASALAKCGGLVSSLVCQGRPVIVARTTKLL